MQKRLEVLALREMWFEGMGTVETIKGLRCWQCMKCVLMAWG